MNYMPLFAHLFGLHPWDMDRLTLDQFRAFRTFSDAWLKSQREG